MTHWLIAPVVVPMVAGAALLLISDRGVRQVLAVLATVALVGVALRLLGAAVDEPQVYLLGNWPAPYGIVLVVDRLSALLVTVTAALALAALVYANASGEDRAGSNFHALFQFQLLGINGAFLTGDLFNLFVFFEILLIASYCLLLHGGGPARARAGVHVVALNLFGSAVFLIAIAVIYSVTGTLNLADLAVKVPAVPEDAVPLLKAGALMLLLVFALKAALFPLYFWLPGAYTSACASVAALFAIMTKVGAYAILRVYTLVFGAGAGPLADLAADWLVHVALVTIVAGILGTMASRNLRKLIAYLVIVSVGTLLVSIGLFTQPALAAATYYMVHSTIATAALFLLADLIRRQRSEAGDRFDARQPVTQPVLLGMLFFVGAVAILGLPPLSGFIGKVAILQAAAHSPLTAWIWGIVLAASFLSLITVSRAASTLFWRTGSKHRTGVHAGTVDASVVGAMIATTVLLAVFGAPILDWTNAVATQLHDPSAYVRAVLGTNPVPGGLR